MKNRRFKRAVSSLSIMLVSVLSNLSFASGYIPVPMDLCLEPYVGVDGQWRTTDFKSGFGNNIFKKDYPELNVYLGLKFNDYFGIEGGYKVSTTQTRTASIGADERAVNLPVSFPPDVYRSTSSFKGWHGELVGFVPIMLPHCVYLLGSIGFSQVNFHARNKFLQNAINVFAENIGLNTFNKTQTVLTLGTGVQIRLDDKSSIRLKIGYENTARINTITSEQDSMAQMKLKDSFTYGVGFVINFL